MKRYFLIILLLLISIVSTDCQELLDESSLTIGNGCFSPKHQTGDGTWRYIEGRIIPNQSSTIKVGVYMSAEEVASIIEGYKHHSLTLGVGLALNFSFQSSWRYSKFGWANIGYKKGKSDGSIRQTNGLFESTQEDDLFMLTSGLIFLNALERAPFLRQKVCLEYQKSLKSNILNKWEGDVLASQPWDNERLKLYFENAVAKISLSWHKEIYFLPGVALGYSYEKGIDTHYALAGASLTLAKGEYGLEIASLTYQPKFDLASQSKIDILYINFDIINIVKLIINT